MKKNPTELEKIVPAVTEATSAVTSSTGHSDTTTKDPQSAEDYGVGLLMIISYTASPNDFYRMTTMILTLMITWTQKRCLVYLDEFILGKNEKVRLLTIKTF